MVYYLVTSPRGSHHLPKAAEPRMSTLKGPVTLGPSVLCHWLWMTDVGSSPHPPGIPASPSHCTQVFTKNRKKGLSSDSFSFLLHPCKTSLGQETPRLLFEGRQEPYLTKKEKSRLRGSGDSFKVTRPRKSAASVQSSSVDSKTCAINHGILWKTQAPSPKRQVALDGSHHLSFSFRFYLFT